ncbi:MAG: hypothetical protein L0214_10750 [candidate division NC10 bacterium]|nr:hypothetical protein [candidate division NC10 bacterium]
MRVRLGVVADDFTSPVHVPPINPIFKGYSNNLPNPYGLQQHLNPTVLVAGQTWDGRPSSQHEIVVIGGDRVLGSVEAPDVSDLEILVFSPTEVRYINLSSKTGGKYRR